MFEILIPNGAIHEMTTINSTSTPKVAFTKTVGLLWMQWWNSGFVL